VLCSWPVSSQAKEYKLVQLRLGFSPRIAVAVSPEIQNPPLRCAAGGGKVAGPKIISSGDNSATSRNNSSMCRTESGGL